MKLVKQLFHIYIHGSIHVAFAVLSLTIMTLHMFNLTFSLPIAGFAFFGTMFSYNFMKYESFYRLKRPISSNVKIITFLSVAAFIAAGVFFLFLNRVTQITGIVFLALTALYTVPIFPNRPNFRNLSGIKVYIVALCWAGVTTLMPLLDAGMPISNDVLLKFTQRFLLVLILILIFEIIDLKEDDPFLRTIPQAIGIKWTKILNLFLLVPFYFLEFFKSEVDTMQLLINIILVTAMGLFTVFAYPERPRYYTLVWVESIPAFWLLLVLLASGL